MSENAVERTLMSIREIKEEGGKGRKVSDQGRKWRDDDESQ